MHVQVDHIDYEVTISEALRVLLQARKASENPSSDGPVSEATEDGVRDLDVFSTVRLRVDGRRPITVTASEILSLHVAQGGVVGEEGLGGTEGHQRLSVLLTDDGRCVAHMSAEPPSGVAARPVHRVRQLWETSDICALVRECHADIELAPITAARAGPLTTTGRSNLLKHQSTQLTEALQPFVEAP